MVSLHEVRKVKALSNVISVIILMVILLAIFVPTLFYLQSLQSSQPVSTAIANNYVYLKGLQQEQIQYGHPTLYYNKTELVLTYSNGTFVPPMNLTIVGILYLNPSNGVWTNVTTLKYPITVTQGKAFQLPSYVEGLPIIVVTSLGNLFFLTPGSSIGPYSGVSTKGGTIVIAQICESPGSPLGVSTNVTTNIYGKFQNFTTPVAFPNQTGSFAMKVPEYVYYENSKGQVITGVFHNWKVLGVASLNSTTSNSVEVTLGGSTAVIIANYSLLTAYDNVVIVPSVSNEQITLLLDGQSYQIEGTTTLKLPAGFLNLTVVTTQFNSSPSNGVIHHYSYSNVTYDNKVYNTLSMLLFLPPQTTPTIYVNYVNDYNYYYVTVEWEGGQGYCLIYNSGQVTAEPIPQPCVVYWSYGVYTSCSYYWLSHAITLNCTVYQYGQSYWLKGGNYEVSTIGVSANLGSWGFSVNDAVLELEYQNGSTFTYYYPDIPSIISVNQPLTIVAIYSVVDIEYHM